MGSTPGLVKLKTMKLVYVASPLSTQHYRRKSKDWLTRKTGNVSELSNISARGLLFQGASTIINIQLSVLIWYNYLNECNLFSPWYSWNVAYLALSNNASPTQRRRFNPVVKKYELMVKLKSTSVWYMHARRPDLNKCSALSVISVYPKYKSAYAQKHYFFPRNIPEISFNNGIAISF
jgi:hypothetical protein